MKFEMDRRGLVQSVVIGAAAGLVAAWVMNRFQAGLSSLSQDKESDSGSDEKSEPTTVKSADILSQMATDEPVPDQHREIAGEAVHYGFGAFLGALYGGLCVIAPATRTGFGTAYGAAVVLAGDEALVPAMGLSPPPQKVPASSHAYAIISHVVFGAALEGSMRAIESALLSATSTQIGSQTHGIAVEGSV